MSIMPGYPLPRSQWATSGEACAACDKRFSFFTSKENCACCGRLCCSSCVSAECTLTPMGLPSAICLECFQRIQDWRRNNRETRRDAKSSSPTPALPTPAAGSASPSVHAAIEAKLTTLESELARVKESGHRLREENDSLHVLLAAKDTYIAELATGQKEADASAERATQSTEQVQQQLSAAVTARAETIKALAEVQEKLSTTQEANNIMRKEMDTLLGANHMLQGRIAKLESEAAEHSSGSIKDTEELLRLRRSVAEASTQKWKEVEDAKLQLQAALKENAQLRQDVEAAVANASKVAAELEQLRESALSWTGERRAREEEAERLRAALGAAEEKVSALDKQQQQQIRSLSEKNDKMRAAMKDLQTQKEDAMENYQKERQTRTDLENRTDALMAAVKRYEEREREWSALRTQNADKIQALEEAVERATRDAAHGEEKRQSISKEAETVVALQLADKKRTIDSLTCQLSTTENMLHVLQAEVASSKREIDTLREQLRKAEEAGEAKLTASLTKATSEHEVTQRRMKQQVAANAELHMQLSAKERELKDLQRAHRTVANEMKEQAQLLRRRCGAVQETYEKGRQEWQTSLAELRSALETLEKHRATEAKGNASNPVTAPSAAEMCTSSRRDSRWAQPTKVKEITYLSSDLSYDDIPGVEGLDQWEFDAKAEAARAVVPDTLVRVGYHIALNWLLFPNTTSLRQWVKFLDTVQTNYCANPYHNKVHAACVVQGTYALVLKCPNLFTNMTKMEKRAIVFAAAVHDLRHPGRSEAFLRRTFDATYLHYNGFRVLEQMHTATAFELLGHPELDFTQSDMDDAEALSFHSLVAELIACTYMNSHTTLMNTWARPLRERGSHGYDFANEDDRRTVLGMLLHAADIGAQSRGVDVALKWLDVVEEMYQEGDEEAALRLPISPCNNRSGNVTKGQLFFMETFVIPLFDLIHQLFPVMEAPLQNLRALHAYYSDALKEVPLRPFPPPIQYGAEAASTEAARAASSEREAAVTKREAKVAKREKALEQAVQRLRQATAAVAQREAQLTAKEAESHVQDSTKVSLQTEQQLLRATNAVVQREEAVQRKAAELEKMTAELEEREMVTSQLSSQLASIAERVNRRRQLLRYREAQVRAKEAKTYDSNAREGHADLATLNVNSKESASVWSFSPNHTLELTKLQSVLDKLSSAMSFA